MRQNKGIRDYAVKHAQFFEADSLRLGLTTFTRSLKKEKHHYICNKVHCLENIDPQHRLLVLQQD